MNREDLDACISSAACTADEHVLSCPAPRRAPTPRSPTHTELNGHHGAWVVYDYDNGPYAIALYANAEAAARHAAQQGYGRVGFWPFGAELHDAVDIWEGR